MSDLTCDDQHCYFILSPGPRPPFGQLVDHVYGGKANVDTDGDSPLPASTDWTWLYMQLRSQPKWAPVVEICMIDGEKTAMRVVSEDRALARKTADFLARETGGRLAMLAHFA